MNQRLRIVVLPALFVALSSCDTEPMAVGHESAAVDAQPPSAELVRVGSISIHRSDVDHRIAEQGSGRNDDAERQKALEELIVRARYAQAAMDENLTHDPLVRAEVARLLANRFKEKKLVPELKEIAATPIPESRLRELYRAGESRFLTGEKRQTAVLWLNPHGELEREQRYVAKLAAAREWLLGNEELKANPEQGFSVIAVDHSEHQASRYKGGDVGWLESRRGIDAWSNAVSEIAFALKERGDVSEVVARPEGVFLVRLIAFQPAVVRPFESVSEQLRLEERKRMQQECEARLLQHIEQKYPLRWSASADP
jgi:hypothetical protein